MVRQRRVIMKVGEKLQHNVWRQARMHPAAMRCVARKWSSGSVVVVSAGGRVDG